jgi:UPF0755 protein
MHKRNKNGKWIAVTALAVLAICGIYFYQQNQRYEYFLKTPVDPSDNAKISFIVHKGDSVPEIATSLIGKDLLIDENAFKTYLKKQDMDRKIVAGRFYLKKSQTIPEIAATITDSKQSEMSLTVKEGETVADIDKDLADMEVITPGTFIQAVKDFDSYGKYPFLSAEKQKKLTHPLEGFLFPDTYFINPQHFASEDLIQLMLNNFKKRLGNEITNTGDRTLFDTIIMASIVEKEVRTSKDIPIVAGILWKRLDDKWMIGADSTLLYLKEDNTIDYKDLQKDSPYNTRNHTGLPPGPICNPGLKSIQAALHPATSPYFYYLTKPDTGEVVYAVTNDEHNANKQKYLY